MRGSLARRAKGFAKRATRDASFATAAERRRLKPMDSQSDVKRGKLVFVFNFFDELKRIAGAGKR